MIVTGHQINFLPGVSVMEKLRASDLCIWLDQTQYEHNGFVNRNRFRDDAWMTVPTSRADTYAPINRVRIADSTFRHRAKIARTLDQRLGRKAAWPYIDILERPYKLLVGLNWALLQQLMRDLELERESVFQSHLDAGYPVPVYGFDKSNLRPVSERLAEMVAELGGTSWLSGASGRSYLDEKPFEERGIKVGYFDWRQPNPTAVSLLADQRATVPA